MNPEKARIEFKYEKGPNFQTYYASGLTGGMTARGQLYFSVYVERQSLPRTSAVDIDINTGHASGEREMDIDHHIVREVQAGVLMDISTAVALRNLLDDKIKEFHSAQKAYRNINKQ